MENTKTPQQIAEEKKAGETKKETAEVKAEAETQEKPPVTEPAKQS